MPVNRNECVKAIRANSQVNVSEEILDYTKPIRGVYGLFILNEEDSKKDICVYIGKAENIYSRLVTNDGHLRKLLLGKKSIVRDFSKLTLRDEKTYIDVLTNALIEGKIISARVLEEVRLKGKSYHKDMQALASAEMRLIDTYQAKDQCLWQLPEGRHISKDDWTMLINENTVQEIHSPKVKRIITLQHTESEQHLNGMIGSWQDWDLTEKGIKDAHRIGKSLANVFGHESFTIYASDLLRTRRCADIVADYFGLSPHYEESLREMNLGQACDESKAWAKENVLCKTFANTIDWPLNFNDRAFMGAESRDDLWKRIETFFHQIIESDEENILIVSHDGSLSIFFSMWLSLDVETTDSLLLSGKSGGVSILEIDEDGHRIIKQLNDMSYLYGR